MSHWNPRRPDPRNSWPNEYWDQQSVDSRDGRSPEYWDRQSNDSRDGWSPEYWDRQSSHPWPSESWGQQPTYNCDPWSHKQRDQPPNDFKNSRSQGYYQQTLHRPPLLGHSPVSHEPRFQRSSRQSYSAFHPYRCREPANSYHRKNYPTVATRSLSESSKDSAKKSRKNAPAGNHGNLKAVSVKANTTKLASNTSNATSNAAADNNASKQPKESLPVQVEKNDASEEVLYLYSVGPNEGKLVELVDISENSQISENQDLLAPESNNSYMPVNSNYKASDLTGPKDSTCYNLANTLLNNEKNEHTPKIQGKCEDACCNMCNKSYEELYNNKCDLYIARCGHLFCALCIPQLKIKRKCIKCKNAISNLRKISL